MEKGKVKFEPKIQMHAGPTAHSTSGNVFFMQVYFDMELTAVLFSATSEEHSDSGHCLLLMYYLKKSPRLPLPVNNVCDTPSTPTLPL